MKNDEALIARALTWRYVVALTLVAVLTTAAWVSLRLVISEQKSAAAIVNVSGRQRMLSQRTALFSSLLVTAPKENRPAIRQQLKDAADLMQRSHLGLIRGNDEMGLPPTMSPIVHGMYFDGANPLNRQVEEYLKAVQALLLLKDEELTAESPLLQYIINVSPNLLVSSLDKMVRQYQVEGEEAIGRLLVAETAVWILTLVLLVLEASFIFRPFASRMQIIEKDLYKHQNHLEELVRLRTADLQEKSKELMESEEKFRLISVSAREAILIIGAAKEIIYWNPAAENIFGYTAEEALGKDLHGLLAPPRYHEDFRNGFKHFRVSGQGPLIGKTLEITAFHKTGAEFPIELSISAFQIKGQWQALGVIRDITGRKRAEEDLRHLNETLEQRVNEAVAMNMEKEHLLIQQSRLAAMGEMVGNIAHQWRQPLNALGLLLANIKDANDYHELDTAMLDEQTAKGRQLIQKMSTTIDDFRNFFKPNKVKQPFRASAGVAEAIRLVSDAFKSNNIEIELENSGESCDAMGFPNEFSQVVLNALSNAREALAEQKSSGNVRINVSTGVDTATVSIRDNGGGVPGEILDKVFDPYFTTKEKGTGIGLYMSKMIMDHMDGEIGIRNIEEGAEVLLTLPLAKESGA